jgi:hypothetical protein
MLRLRSVLASVVGRQLTLCCIASPLSSISFVLVSNITPWTSLIIITLVDIIGVLQCLAAEADVVLILGGVIVPWCVALASLVENWHVWCRLQLLNVKFTRFFSSCLGGLLT